MLSRGGQGGAPVGYDDRGSGRALVLLHPFPFARDVWNGLADAFAARYRVLTVDARGFGESPLPAGNGDARYTIVDLADDLATLLGERGIAKATVLGMSMGGYVALAFAQRHPARLEALVLADTRAAADSDQVRAGRDAAIAQIRVEGADAYLSAGLPRLLSPEAPPARVTFARARAETRPASLIAGLEAMRSRPDRSVELSAIRCPTLLVCGERDQVVPSAEMKAMADAIPGAKLVTIAEAGHLAHLEAPGAFERALASFLDGALPAATASAPEMGRGR